MQTFLPMGDSPRPYFDSARVLDRLRLNKQRTECKQIYIALTENRGWIHHPATKMWKGYESDLALYACYICEEWRRRGFKDSLLPYFQNIYYSFDEPEFAFKPPWLQDIASSHRAALLAKDYQWYSQFNWKEEPKIDYYWPTKHYDKQQSHASIL